MLATLQALDINHVSNIQMAAWAWLLSERNISVDQDVKDEDGEDV